MLRKVMMDIAVGQRTGGPPADTVEQCDCPSGYSGLSCEECAPGHHRDEEGGDCDPDHVPQSPGYTDTDLGYGRQEEPQNGYPGQEEAFKGYPRPVEPEQSMKGFPRPQLPPSEDQLKGFQRPQYPDPYQQQPGGYQEQRLGPISQLTPPPPSGPLCPSVTVTISPPEQTIPQGGSAVMRCSGAGQGDILSWSKVGADLSSPSVTVTDDTITVR